MSPILRKFDVNRSRVKVAALLLPCAAAAQIILTEVMFDLVGSDSPNEFVELYNASAVPVNVSGWRLRDRLAEDSVLEAGEGTILAPGSWAVVFEGDYDLVTGLYATSLPDSALTLKVDDLSIGNGLSLSDSLFLVNATGATVDSIGWDDPGPEGFSYERIRLDLPSTPDNWTASKDSLGTPGRKNSVALLDVDGELVPSSLSFSPAIPTPTDPIIFTATLRNRGLQAVEGELVASENDSVLASTSVGILGPEDSITLSLTLQPLSSGIHTVACIFEVPEDQNDANNRGGVMIAVRFARGILVINEILYAPEGGVSEFVEVANVSGEAIDMAGWRVADASDTSGAAVSRTVEPESYAVFAPDSTAPLPSWNLLAVVEAFPALNNSGDTILLLDPTYTVIDSITFSPDWGGESGRSLEKLHPGLPAGAPTSWGTCVALQKMTPGERNSLYFATGSGYVSLTISPNPFSPDGDGTDDLLRIAYRVPFAEPVLTAEVFDLLGRPVATLAVNLASPSEGVVTWDGRMKGGGRCRVGVYVVAVELRGPSGEKRSWVREVVLARRLH